jgi:4-hydroxy-tetrahydrodipicolinate synthase|uniref:4-hydroxy-tetrahydrodipicolinate synthase n=1 Tax=candidate division WOR-3 bacterium TaxID=2052148 RepID=A0A7C6A904_UNCW3
MLKANALRGSIVALITPLRKEKVDLSGLVKNLRFQLKNKTFGFVPCGTTGEAPTLTEEEWEAVIATTVKTVAKKAPVIAGAGTNCTRKTIGLVKRAKELGADAVLLVAPYYNKPTQEGLYRHFRSICDNVDIPVVIYNIPGRTGVNILPRTLARLVEDCSNIIGVKEASGNLDQIAEVIARCGERISVLSGDDSLTLPILSIGGRGVISVIANIVPKDLATMIEYYFKGKIEKANKLNKKLFALAKAMFVETNPIPIKTAMNLLGMPAGDLRLPLCEPSAESFAIIKKALIDYGFAISSRGKD